MKIDPLYILAYIYYQPRRCSPNTRFWQYKVYVDIRSGSQDLCKFSLDLRIPVSIYYTGMVCRTRFQIHVFGWSHLATNRLPRILDYRRDQRRRGKRSSEL